jgi:hypothetical protein
MNKQQILGILRHVLTFAGGVVVAKGWVDETLITELIGGVITLAGTVWSVIEKYNATPTK